MALVKACDLTDLSDDEIYKAELDGAPPIAIYLIDGEVFATHDTCTHGEASLSEDGYIEDGTVVCSWHEGAFDIRTGQACRLPCMDPLRKFVVQVIDGEVFVDLD
ncbi:non-heme iron oxygenase ferredoxin subunit [Sandaracinobacter sp. RS1-74]|uniref:non-heme iron oxygenase ferredoxin subunit n=1 Tax=Sandaracinobacteroides sayramensis TaxID=2913411 RepID=UPI001EDB558F|nr:non-heme iron oxygenase ferredoxin subunit [Sandaracinobacteroides sayramensis]MCG2840901.1 non-heme iron oxygenase ferredoxin subunit [Sandaracinobacteroides sayramensis]